MAGTSVLKLKVDDKEYNSSLKQAQQGMQHLEQALKDAGKSFNQVDKAVVNYVRGIGQMEAQSKTARGRIGEMTSAFVELSQQYNKMSDDVKQGDVGKALAQSMEQLKQRTIEAKKELEGLNREISTVKMPEMKGGGGLFSGMGDKMSGALQVFAGNMLTKAAGAVANLGSEMADMVKQGIELAKQGEGIRIAFERLGRGDILDGLRQATHGTVTDLELMKAAVKFNDFKLPLDELGTMLAFAQQKAKDTGQSVDYMVDSIVTGLGRKSLMILDNLGLSATEVKERMAETGDMTKAVGAIIREQMAKAGDYIETATDRATKADVELKNAMEDLGRTFQPLTDASNGLWNSIKVGALNALNTAVKPLIDALAEAGALGSGARATAGFNRLGGGSKVDRMIGRLGNGKTSGSYSIYTQQLGEFDKYINNKRFQIAAFGSDNSGIAQSAKQRLQAQLDGALKMRAEYVKRAQELHNKVPSPFEPATTSGGATDGGGGTAKTINTKEITYASDSIAAQAKLVQDLTKQWNEAGADVRDKYVAPLIEAEQKLKEMKDQLTLAREQSQGRLLGGTQEIQGLGSIVSTNIPSVNDMISIIDKLRQKSNSDSDSDDDGNGNRRRRKEKYEPESVSQVVKDLSGNVGGILTGLNQLGVEIPEGLQGVIGGIQGMMTILTSINSILSIIEALQTVKSLPLFSYGGVIGRAAAGLLIPGNSNSGDNLRLPMMDGSGFIGVNSGELILNKSQQNNLANALEGGGLRGMNLSAQVSGEQILLVANRTLRRKGKGELVTWK